MSSTHASSIVIVEALINDRGTVDDVKILKGLPFGLDLAAADAVQQWTFRPATQDDQPVPVVVNLVVNFGSDRKEVVQSESPEAPYRS